MSKSQLLAKMASLQCRSVPTDQRAAAGGSDTLCVAAHTSFGGSAASLTVALLQDRVTLVLFNRIDAREYDALAELMTKKFGPPDGAGPSEEVRALRWSRDGRVLGILHRDRQLDTSVALSAVVETKKAVERIRDGKESDL